MNPATFITLSTLRLEATGNGASSIGTGFLYNYILEAKPDEGKPTLTVPVILTNKHVLVGRDTLSLTVTLCPEGSAIGDRPSTQDDTHLSLRIGELPKSIILHPSHDVDLCAVPVAELLRQIPAGQRLRHTFIDRATHLSPEESNITRAIEPIVMIGYPSGLWDEHNNLPIARRGQTATHPLLKWNNQRKFVIDAACFPGSSGSPVFIYEDGMFRTEGGAPSPGTRARLIGLLCEGPQITQEGRLEPRPIPATTTIVPVVNGMMNLGYVVQADAIDDLLPVIISKIESTK